MSLLRTSWTAAAVSALMLGFAASRAIADEMPGWAFPSCTPGAPDPAAQRIETLPGSRERYSRAVIAQRSTAIDWFPDRHAPLPAVVAAARTPGKAACGYCHLPDGAGRPENAKIAGLPETYIVRQVELIHDRVRQSAVPDYPPVVLMRASLDGLSAEDIQAAAHFFASQAPRSFERVVETERTPAFAPKCFVLAPAKGPTQALGERIVERADQLRPFELRDPRTTYTAFVPKGSLRRGEALVAHGNRGAAPCASCHGQKLTGAAQLPGPPLAGRFAGYVVRQLYGFRSGARGGEAAQVMQPVAAALSARDIIDVAAYAASLAPQ